MSTVWVKTTSHRQRAKLIQTFAHSDLDEPQPYFRRSTHPCQLRQRGEFWEVPEHAVQALSTIKGLVVLKRPVPADELIKPWSST